MYTTRISSKVLVSSNVTGSSNTVVVNGKTISGRGASDYEEQHVLVKEHTEFKEVEIELPLASKLFIESHPDVNGVEARISGCRDDDIAVEVSDGVLSIRDSNDVERMCSVFVRVPDSTYEKITVSTSSGDVVLDELGCVSFDIETMSGDISIRKSEFVECSAKSMSGDIDIEFNALVDTDLNIKTMSGDVDVEAANIGSCTLDFETMSGDVFDGIKLSSPNSGNVLGGRISTMSGDIKLK